MTNKPTPFAPDAGNTASFRKYHSGPFVLILRSIDGPWTPENITAEIRVEQVRTRYAVCRTIRDRTDPNKMTLALDLSNVPSLIGLSGADQIRSELSEAQYLATEVKKTIEAECPGLEVHIEP